ncbi:hypothetical protein P7M35_21815 [Vibrio parahaemolyticus]|nr:hypothetical protein [Vibrio parahaemolyticus]
MLLVKPEEIYLLLCLVKNKGIGSGFSNKSIEISKEFGVSLNSVTSLFTTLKSTHSIIVEEQYSLKGRGQYSYTLTEKVLLNHDEFGVLERIIQTKNPTISRLLNNELSGLVESEKSLENEDGDTRQRSPFRAANRLFLILLLLHSNELGVVAEISSTYIRKIMGGISAERFKSQLNTLKQLCLVKRHIAGITGKELFGRTKGSYYLSIEHPYLQESYAQVNSLRLDFNSTVTRHNESTEIICLFDAYRYSWDFSEQRVNIKLLERYTWLPVVADVMRDVSIEFVISFFQNRALHDQMHQWVYQVSSELLLHSFDSVEDIAVNLCSDELIRLLSLAKSASITKQKAIRESVSAIQKTKLRMNPLQFLTDVLNFDADRESSQSSYWQYVALTRLILLFGLKVSLRYKRLLELGHFDLSQMSQCVIVPMPTQGRFCLVHQIQFLSKQPFKAQIKADFEDERQVRYWLTNELTHSKEQVDVISAFLKK